MIKLLIGLIILGLAFGGLVYINQPELQIKEKVCYPEIYSIQNGEVVVIEESKCMEVER